MKVEIPLGDVVDKITILKIKLANLSKKEALQNAKKELSSLINAWHSAGLPKLESLSAYPELATINSKLWHIEDQIRLFEKREEFGDAFIQTARMVYKLNDQRASLKRQINHELGSSLTEEKSYV